MDTIKIVKKALQDCYDKDGIVAGRRHFNDYWARDSFYASWGALILNNKTIVKKNLEIFLKATSFEGQVPIRIGVSKIGQWLSLGGIKLKTKIPVYSQDKGLNPALDPNLLMLITLEKYMTKTKDIKLLKKYITKIYAIIYWLEKREYDGLLYGGKYHTWQDTIKKNGFALYTNVLYYQAVVSLSAIFKRFKKKNELEKKAEIIKEKINEKFWDDDKGYYLDYFNKYKKCKVFSPDGNFFAILFEVANKNQTESILKYAKDSGISSYAPSFTNSPKYNFFQVYKPLYFVNMQGYHNKSICWPWIGALHSMALTKAGKKEESKEILNNISRLIIEHNNVYEVHEKNGKPVKRLFYKSEKPFAWAASFYLLAHNKNSK